MVVIQMLLKGGKRQSTNGRRGNPINVYANRETGIISCQIIDFQLKQNGNMLPWFE